MGRGGRELRGRARCSSECVRVGARRRQRRPGRARRRRQRLARRFGRGAASRRIPTCRSSSAPGNVGYARAANLGIAATRADVVAVLERRHARSSPGTAGALVARLDADAAARGVRTAGRRTSTAPTTRRRGSSRRRSVAVMHGLARARGGRRTRSRARYRQLDARRDRARPVDWVSGAAVWLRRTRARRRRRLGRALLHVPRGRRSLLAVAARGLGDRVRTRRASCGTCRARAPPAGRTGCSPSTTGRRGASPAAATRVCGRCCCRSRPCIWLARASLGDGRARLARDRRADTPTG